MNPSSTSPLKGEGRVRANINVIEGNIFPVIARNIFPRHCKERSGKAISHYNKKNYKKEIAKCWEINW